MEKLKKILNREVIFYTIFGVLTTVVNITVSYILKAFFHVETNIASTIGIIACIIFAYFTNRIYVFKSKSKNIFMEAVKFMLSRVLTLLLDMLVMFIFATLLLLDYSLAKLISMVLVTIGNYIISKVLVFNEKDKACNN